MESDFTEMDKRQSRIRLVPGLGIKWCPVPFFIAVITFFIGIHSLSARETVDRIIAVVNNDIVSLSELNQRVSPYMDKINRAGYSLAQKELLIRKVRQEHLDLLIDEKLADQEINRLKIKVSQNQVDQALERFRASNKITMEELRAALVNQGRSLADFRKEIKAQILRARLVNREIRSKIVITDDEISAYYKNHPDEFGGEKKYHLRNIVIPLAKIDLKDGESDQYRKIKDISASLAAGEPFADLARKYSKAPNAADGGDLGTIRAEMLAPEIRRAIESLKPGGVTDIIETDQGYQVFYLEAVDTKAEESFEKVRARIEDTLYNQVVDQKYREWLKDLRARAHIKLIK